MNKGNNSRDTVFSAVFKPSYIELLFQKNNTSNKKGEEMHRIKINDLFVKCNLFKKNKLKTTNKIIIQVHSVLKNMVEIIKTIKILIISLNLFSERIIKQYIIY